VRHILITCLLILVTFNFGMSQSNDVEFKVLSTRGENRMKSSSGIVTIKTGLAINSDAIVEVVGNGMLGLMYKNGRTLELKNAGEYNVSDLVKQALAKSNSSVSTQYAKYVLAQVTKGNDPVVTKPGKNMGVTGAVMRAMKSSNANSIDVYIPDTEILLESQPVIHWGGIDGATGYTVHIVNMENTILLSQNTIDTFAVVDLYNIPLLKDESLFMVKVQAKGKTNHSLMIPLNISKMDPDNRDEFVDIKNNLDKNSATDWISLALFCQRFNLNVDAYHAYEMAIKIAPDLPEYKSMFIDFKNQVNLKETMEKR